MVRFLVIGLGMGLAACGEPGEGDTGATMSTLGVDVGAQLYETNCQGCHGVSGEGGLGVVLNDGLLESLSDDDIAGVIRDGIPPGMLGFSNQLNDEEIDELIGFLRANFDN
jgi:mono/diheme cytochrome c family protein